MINLNLNVTACPHEWNVIYPTYPLVNRGSVVLFSSSSFLYWSFSIKVLFSFLTLAYFAPLYDFLGLVDLLIWFPQMLVLTNNMKCWYNFYQYLFQLLVWWATYLCLEWGSDASFAFFRVNTPSFYAGWHILVNYPLFSSILCTTDLAWVEVGALSKKRCM